MSELKATEQESKSEATIAQMESDATEATPAEATEATPQESDASETEQETEATPAEQESDATEATPDASDASSFYSRQQLLILHIAGRVPFERVFAICAERQWEFPSKAELKLKSDKTAAKKAINPFELAHIVKAKAEIEKRFTAAKRKKRKALENAIASAATKTQKALDKVKICKANAQTATDALGAFDVAIIAASAGDMDYLTKAGKTQTLCVSLSSDGKANLAKAKGKGSDTSEPYWFAGHKYSIDFVENAKKGRMEAQTAAFTILTLNASGKRIQSIHIDDLPNWYDGDKIKKGANYAISARALFENHLNVKYNLRLRTDAQGQVMTATAAKALYDTIGAKESDASDKDASDKENDASDK